MIDYGYIKRRAIQLREYTIMIDEFASKMNNTISSRDTELSMRYVKFIDSYIGSIQSCLDELNDILYLYWKQNR